MGRRYRDRRIATGAPWAGNYAALTSLVHTKCFNHGAREAVARCPGCKRHYCRECVTEHEHRLLCASCIASIDTETDSARRPIPFAGLFQLSSALFVLWISFYVMGQLLLLIPSTYHDNQETMWDQFQVLEREREREKEAQEEDESSELLSRGDRSP